MARVEGVDVPAAAPLGQGALTTGVERTVLLAHDVVPRNAHIREEHLVNGDVARQLAQRPHLDARRLHVDQDVGDAPVLEGVGLRAT